MKKTWYPLFGDGIALLSGALLSFTFAPYDIFPVAILCLSALLFVWLDIPPQRAFWRGFLFGLGIFGFGVYWVYISLHTFGGAPLPLALFFTAMFICILALFPATTGYLLSRYFPATNPTKIFCAFPALWVLMEWIRSWIATGFPWLLLGYTQTNSPLHGYAPIFSVYGVSLMVLWSSALIVTIFLTYQQKNYKRVYYNFFILACIWILGSALTLISWTTPKGEPLHINLVQGNIPQTLKWSPQHVQLSLDRYAELTQTLWQKNALIIWPEAAIPLSLQDAESYINEMNAKAMEHQATLLTGIPVFNEERGGYFNAVVALGAKQGVYIKRRLVPFGEYIPFPKFIKPIYDYINIPMNETIPGAYVQPPLIVNGIKILTFICYEIIFPEQVLSHDKSIGMLLTVTNDAWYGRSAAQAQHLQMAQMRSIENGRPGIFVSNDGITAVIAPNGRIISSIPPFESAVLTANVQAMQGLTPWQRFAMVPLFLVILSLLFFAFRYRDVPFRFSE